jgi:hypothetical protein
MLIFQCKKPVITKIFIDREVGCKFPGFSAVSTTWQDKNKYLVNEQHHEKN